MTDTSFDASGDVLNANAQGRLRTIIERIERLEEDKAAILQDQKEVYLEAKGEDLLLVLHNGGLVFFEALNPLDDGAKAALSACVENVLRCVESSVGHGVRLLADDWRLEPHEEFGSGGVRSRGWAHAWPVQQPSAHGHFAANAPMRPASE